MICERNECVVIWVSENEVTILQRPLLLETSHQKIVLGLKISWISKFHFAITMSLNFCHFPLLMFISKCLQNISLKRCIHSRCCSEYKVKTLWRHKLGRYMQTNCIKFYKEIVEIEKTNTQNRNPDNCLLTQLDKLCKGPPGPNTIST